MVQPYIKDGAITYSEFDNIYSILSLREQYDVIEILFRHGIELIDEQIDEETVILDVEDSDSTEDRDDEFEVLYDESIFKDDGDPADESAPLFVQGTVKQSNEVLCSLIQQGNRQAMQDLCIKNKRLVDKYVAGYVKRYGNRLDFEDLEQVGFLGLIKAAKKFSIQLGTAFSTYAVFWIKQSISREIMDNGYAIRIPVHMMERIAKVGVVDNRLLGNGVPIKERISCIAKELGLKEDDVESCLILRKNFLSYTSLDVPIGEDEESELGEFIPDESADSVEDIVVKRELRRQLDETMKSLTPRERDILELRFGWNDDRGRTLEEIGEMYGVTRERIRQIEAKALRKLRHPVRIKKINDFREE